MTRTASSNGGLDEGARASLFSAAVVGPGRVYLQ